MRTVTRQAAEKTTVGSSSAIGWPNIERVKKKAQAYRQKISIPARQKNMSVCLLAFISFASWLGKGWSWVTYALMDFWSRYSNAATLSFEAIAHAPGGPGRVFLFDENDVADRLAALDEVTNGALRWSETAGLKQVIRNIDIDESAMLSYVPLDYGRIAGKEAA